MRCQPSGSGSGNGKGRSGSEGGAPEGLWMGGPNVLDTDMVLAVDA